MASVEKVSAEGGCPAEIMRNHLRALVTSMVQEGCQETVLHAERYVAALRLLRPPVAKQVMDVDAVISRELPAIDLHTYEEHGVPWISTTGLPS